MTLPNSDLKIPKTSKESSFKIVRSTIESLRNLIETQPWNDLKSLVILVHQKAKMYERSVSDSTPTLHVCLRILKIAREEALKVLLGGNADFEENSTNRLFASGDTTYETIVKSDLLDGVLSALDEFLVDINTCSENISDLSLDLIHSDELILTRGFSQAAYHFLRRAAEKKRMFKVIVCEGYPDNLGHKFAEDLSKEGINVILVPDSHAFGLMSRVNKVIIGCNAVYPDGTMKAPIGTHSVLLAAKHFTIPVIRVDRFSERCLLKQMNMKMDVRMAFLDTTGQTVEMDCRTELFRRCIQTYVCLPQYKLSPLPLKMSDSAPPLFTVLPTADPCNSSPDWLDGPAKILPIDDPVVTSSDLSHRSLSNGPVVWMPRWELIPAGLVNLFLTNLGSHAPSYLYALGRELFHPLDIQMAISVK